MESRALVVESDDSTLLPSSQLLSMQIKNWSEEDFWEKFKNLIKNFQRLSVNVFMNDPHLFSKTKNSEF